MTDLERLLSKASVGATDECWPWQAHRKADGYGRFWFEKTDWLAHRASWTLHNGPIPPGMDVLHSCDNPPCINPAHLFLGDDFANQQDRVRKGRHKGVTWDQRGELNPGVKLTTEDVLAIRALYASEGVSQKTVAARFGVGQALVSLIVNRKVWAHI